MTTPAEYIDQIISQALTTANTNTASATAAANQIIDEASGWYLHHWSPNPLPAPEAIEPDLWDANGSSLQTFNAYTTDIIGKLSDQLAYFFATYYPLDSDAYDEAQAWLVNAITNGGTGIPVAVEQEIWQRGRDRLITDARSASAQVLSGGASLGMPLPDGAVTAATRAIQLKRLQETGQQSTQISAKQAEIEIETIRFAVEMAINSRKIALDAAADYIRGIAGGIGTAVDVANLDGDKRAQMMNAVASLYRARLSRDELILNSSVTKRGQDRQHWLDKDNSHWNSIDSKVKAAASAADVFRGTATAALTSLNAIASTATSAFS